MGSLLSINWRMQPSARASYVQVQLILDETVGLVVADASVSENLCDILKQVLHKKKVSFHSIEAQPRPRGIYLSYGFSRHRTICNIPRSSERWTCKHPSGTSSCSSFSFTFWCGRRKGAAVWRVLLDSSENGFSSGQREIFSQGKFWRPQEYFVYFKGFKRKHLRKKIRCFAGNAVSGLAYNISLSTDLAAGSDLNIRRCIGKRSMCCILPAVCE